MHLLKFAAVGFTGILVLTAPLSAQVENETAATKSADAPPAETDRQARIKQLIADLSSPDETVRTAAMQQLVTMGEDAQQALQEHIRSRDAAQAALQQIEVNKVAGPTLITLDVTNASVLEVMEALSKQTGFALRPYHDNMFDNANLPTITLSVKDAPFWQVMRQVMAQGEVVIYESHDNENALRLMPQRNMGRTTVNAPFSLNGAFMVVATQIQRSNSVSLANPEQVNRNMSMQLQVYAEPKVNILRYSHQPEIEEAVDDKGNSLANRQSSSSYSSGRSSVWQMHVPLIYPENPGSKIARLRGNIKMTVQTRSEKLEVEDILNVKDKTETVAGRRVVIASVTRPNDNQCQVKIIAHRDGMEQQAFYDWMNNRQAMQLLDKDGRAWYPGGYSTSSSGDQYETTRQFFNNRGDQSDAPGEPVKLIWEIPTGTQEITIPFEFTDLPLP